MAAGLSLLLSFILGAPPVSAAPKGAVTPLPADIAKDLAILGKGVVGKALPAPPVDDVKPYLNLGDGKWEYQILSGGKDGAKVRTESYEKGPDVDGAKTWQRTLGTEYVEYLKLLPNGDLSKYLEDDLELGYTSRFLPGPLWHAGTKAGETSKGKGTIEAFKTDKPDHISYTGKMNMEITYVGAYEVTTPAGTWPAILIKTDYTIKIGPANVSDTMYVFYAKGIGKLAEIEATRVSALLIYHSTTNVAKVLKSYPKR
jgi:hypothetical protein